MPSPQPVLLMSRQLEAGGTERQLAGTALALDRTRFEPHVCCFHEGFRAEELRAAGVPLLRLPIRSFGSAAAIAGALQLGRYSRQHGIQVVHSWDYPTNEFGVPVARAFRVPVVISSQRAHRALAGRFSRHLLRLTDHMVDAVVVNSQFVRRHLIEDERVPARLIRVCYNGVDSDVFRPAEGPRPCFPGGASLVIGVVCVLRPEKGLPTLLEAFARVRHLRPGMKLLIAGSGPMLGELQARAAAAGAAADCRFEPARKDVLAWLQAIDIFVLPSLLEAFSNSLMEAMACGCAAVASDVGGNPELVVPGRTGLLFRAGDAADLAESLSLLIENEPLRGRLATEGRHFIVENFSWPAAARRIADLYEELLDRSGR